MRASVDFERNPSSVPVGGQVAVLRLVAATIVVAENDACGAGIIGLVAFSDPFTFVGLIDCKECGCEPGAFLVDDIAAVVEGHGVVAAAGDVENGAVRRGFAGHMSGRKLIPAFEDIVAG